VQDNPPLFCGSTTIELPLRNDAMLTIIKQSPLGFKIDEKEIVATQVNVVNLGNARCSPSWRGPAQHRLLPQAKHARRAQSAAGLTNDAFGYILTKVDWTASSSTTTSRERAWRIDRRNPHGEGLAFIDKCPRPAAMAAK